MGRCRILLVTCPVGPSVRPPFTLCCSREQKVGKRRRRSNHTLRRTTCGRGRFRQSRARFLLPLHSLFSSSASVLSFFMTLIKWIEWAGGGGGTFVGSGAGRRGASEAKSTIKQGQNLQKRRHADFNTSAAPLPSPPRVTPLSPSRPPACLVLLRKAVLQCRKELLTLNSRVGKSDDDSVGR